MAGRIVLHGEVHEASLRNVWRRPCAADEKKGAEDIGITSEVGSENNGAVANGRVKLVEVSVSVSNS